MSKYSTQKSKNIQYFQKLKTEGKKISALTCYDAAFGKILAKSDIDIVLVGDSLGNVILGHDSTIQVTIEDMIHHTAAVSRVLEKPFLCADMPFLTYATPVKALDNAGRLIQQGGAQSVKLEGGESICEQIATLVSNGIPVVGHLGFTPQSLHQIGGYKVAAKTDEARKQLLKDALCLQEAGAFAVILEMVPAAVAAEVTASLKIPTIGIGAGGECDGQILVLHDILGFDDSFQPKFVKRYANLGNIVSEAINSFDQEVKSKSFPNPENAF